MDRTIFGFGIACLLLMVSVRPGIAQPVLIPGQDLLGVAEQSEVKQHSAEVAALSGLSTSSAEKLPDTMTDPKQVAAEVATGISQVHTYGSWSAMLDHSIAALAEHGYVVSAWTSDVVEPDAVSTTQTGWDGNRYLYDEWVTIKGQEYVNSGLWFKPGRAVHSGLDPVLDLRKYGPVLQQEQPASGGRYRYGGQSYVLLTYRDPVAGDFARFFRDEKGQALPGTLQLELWVDESSHRLVKARISRSPVDAADENKLEVEQVFIGYGDGLLIYPPVVNAVPNGAVDALTSIEGFSRFAMMYYLSPQPDKVADAIRALDATGLATQLPKPTYSPFVNWFAEVFLANPDRLPEWRKLVNEQKGAAKELLQGALNVAAKGGLLNMPPMPPAPAWNDMYWSGFFATGNPAYVRKLIDQMNYIDERKDVVRYLAGGTAEWSLSSNAQQHPKVREIVQQARAGADARIGPLIDDLLSRDPTVIRAEVFQVAQQINSATRQRQ